MWNYKRAQNNMSVSIWFQTFILCFLFCNTFTKRMSLPVLDKPSLDKLNECKRCKLLSDSFNHWIEKTSRGKYEGGDTAWEETKLKSYARSEIRLIEIQENLCSELRRHQDDCYMLAEEAEQVLEKWWFNEGPNSADLYTWLCIENLQYCCPKDHFGSMCTPCLRDRGNKVCSGHGKCDGDSTRKGNGTCLCEKGYDGTLCDECGMNYFITNIGLCEPCHKACNGCSGEGVAACTACNPGWQLELNGCQDIDECLDKSICKSNQYCVNKEGYHKCKPCHDSCKTCSGDGHLNCTSCELTHVLLGGFCLNDENKSDIIKDTIRRLALYLGLFIISYFIFRHSNLMSSLVVLIITIYIYYCEKSCELTSWNVIVNLVL